MTIRKPAVAGTLYESDTQRLLAKVEAWLDDKLVTQLPKPAKALIVPHSSYLYSGNIAAKAFQLLAPVYGTIKRVIIIGTAHRDKPAGIALPEADIFRTPLGDIEVDTDVMNDLLSLPDVYQLEETHRTEHSIEVELPFLQTALDDFKIVPIVVGDCPSNLVVEVLEKLWGGPETLIVISTGLSRKLPFELAKERDQRTSERIRFFDQSLTYEDACGYTALNGFLNIAQQKRMDSKRLAISTSADVAGKKESVRGFASFAFY